MSPPTRDELPGRESLRRINSCVRWRGPRYIFLENDQQKRVDKNYGV
jgi:hypothetical protein